VIALELASRRQGKTGRSVAAAAHRETQKMVNESEARKKKTRCEVEDEKDDGGLQTMDVDVGIEIEEAEEGAPPPPPAPSASPKSGGGGKKASLQTPRSAKLRSTRLRADEEEAAGSKTAPAKRQRAASKASPAAPETTTKKIKPNTPVSVVVRRSPAVLAQMHPRDRAESPPAPVRMDFATPSPCLVGFRPEASPPMEAKVRGSSCCVGRAD
jgi:hypothetical protein